MNANTYKNGINEGGEGYNPFVKTESAYNRTLHQCRIMDKMNSMRYIVAQQEKEFGFSLDSLKKAVALNKL